MNYIVDYMQEDKVAVIVGTVTDDVRLYDMPKMRVCALRFTETARARITKVRDCIMLFPCSMHDCYWGTIKYWVGLHEEELSCMESTFDVFVCRLVESA